MPVDDLYWNAIDFGSDESLHEFQSKHYVDPWDLENYAYIREQLDTMDINSSPSGESSAEFAGSSGEFAEANSTSFYYVPARKLSAQPPIENKPSKRNSVVNEQGTYVAIDEVKIYETTRLKNELRDIYGPVRSVADFDSETDESPYEDSISPFPRNKNPYGKPIPAPSRTPRDRSLSFSYGDHIYDVYGIRQEIYSKLEDDIPMPLRQDSTLSEDGRSRRKPRNFGLSNYGHLKIDYSYSWNNLNKYICN